MAHLRAAEVWGLGTIMTLNVRTLVAAGTTLALLSLFGCGPKHTTLTINVVTSLVAGPEFTDIDVALLDPNATLGSDVVLSEADTPVTFGQSFAAGRTAAEFFNTPIGDKVVRVQLKRADNTLLVQRRVHFKMTGTYAITVYLTRDCVGVMCPLAGGSAALSECMSAQCVDPRCDPNDPSTRAMYCPAVTFCNSASDCSPVNSCAMETCVEGVCIPAAVTPSTCTTESYCNPVTGCTPLMSSVDGGVDAGSDAASGDAAMFDGSIDGAIDAEMDAAMDGMIVDDMGANGDASGGADSGMSDMGVGACSIHNGGCGPAVACDDSAGTATCGACLSGYSGDPTSGCVDVDECLVMNGGCDSLTSCLNIPGSFVCGACPSGYSGTGMTGCVDINECTVNNGGCAPAAHCTNTIGSFLCGDCQSGYTGDGISCTDINECMAGTSNCDPRAGCSNTPGSFMCGMCPSGYAGDGTICLDINECTFGTSNCSTNAACTNTMGSFTCQCAPGFSGDGVTCTDLNECALGANNCDANATCSNTPGSFTCGCKTGYTGDGTSCSDVDECANSTNNCGSNATCTNTVGAFSCACNTGFSGNGITCIDNNECATSNGGCAQTCTNTSGSFTCGCTSGYALNVNGTTCDDVNECMSGTNNCSANAACTNTVGSFTCMCNSGFVGNGVTCTDTDECMNGTAHCDASATCTNLPGSFACECNNGFIGDGATCTARNTLGAAAGIDYSCELFSDGTVGCWGNNTAGQLGTGNAVQHFTPTPVLVAANTPLTNVVQIASENTTTCALLNNGTVKCWGANDVGQIGNGGSSTRTFATSVSGISNAVSIAAGYEFACAILRDSTVKCWGNNSAGQLGDGTTISRLTPVAAHNLTNVVSLGLGNNHACAIFNNGSLYCWGDNTLGELGDGTFVSRTTPLPHTGADVAPFATDAATQVACGDQFSCAIATSGNVWCWGSNDWGQAGIGSTPDPYYFAAPVMSMASGKGMTALYANSLANPNVGSSFLGRFICGQTSANVVYCWGENVSGEVGNSGPPRGTQAPVQVAGVSNVAALGVGQTHVVAIENTGAEQGWGTNAFGQLGNSNTDGPQMAAVHGSTLHDVTSVVAGGTHTCAIYGSNGQVACWGSNSLYQLATPAFASPSFSPIDVPNLTNVAQIVAGNAFTYALKNDGTMWGWGDNAYDQVTSYPATYLNPTNPGLSDIVVIGAGEFHTCAVNSVNHVWCWGKNSEGQWGMSAGTMSNVPNPVPGTPASQIVAMDGGYGHTCLLTASHQVLCWGNNTSGELGIGSTSVAPVTAAAATPVAGIGTMGDVPVAISAGGSSSITDSTCAVTQSGAVYCWGDNSYGQLGDGTFTTRTSPVLVTGVSGATSVSVGRVFTCARLSSGTVKCWGDNSNGQLGNGTTTASTLAVTANIANASSVSVSDFASTGHHACALVGTDVSCWGAGVMSGTGVLNGNVTTPTPLWSGWM